MSRPDKIDGLKLWWDADDTSTINEGRITPGGQVMSWRDKVSGFVLRGREDALPWNFGATYSVGFINGRNSIYFGYYVAQDWDDLSIKALSCAEVTPLSSGTYSVFIVYRHTANQDNGRVRPPSGTPFGKVAVFPYIYSGQPYSNSGQKCTSRGILTQANVDTPPIEHSYTNGGNDNWLMSIMSKSTFQNYNANFNWAPEWSIPTPFSTSDALGQSEADGGKIRESPFLVGVTLTSIVSSPSSGSVLYSGTQPAKFIDVKRVGDLPILNRSGGKYQQYWDSTASPTASKVNIVSARSMNDGQGSGQRYSSVYRRDYTFKYQMLTSRTSQSYTSPVQTLAIRGPVMQINNPILTIGSYYPNATLKDPTTGATISNFWNRTKRERFWQQEGAPYEGHFCEYIFYDRILNDAEMMLVEDYLQRKWLK